MYHNNRLTITLNTFQIPETLEAHIKAQHGEGTRAAWIKTFQWALDTYPFLEVKERLVMVRAGMVLRYRTFIRDYNLNILSETEARPTSCFSFLSCHGRRQ